VGAEKPNGALCAAAGDNGNENAFVCDFQGKEAEDFRHTFHVFREGELCLPHFDPDGKSAG
jgi:hypothetical protein